MMKIFRWLLTTMLLLALSGAFAVLWVNEQFRQEYELAGMTEVSVPRGAGLNRTGSVAGRKGRGGRCAAVCIVCAAERAGRGKLRPENMLLPARFR